VDSDVPRWTARFGRAFWSRPWLWAWVAISILLVPILSFRHQSELIGCYLPACQRLFDGLSLPGPEGWVYPPFFSTPTLLLNLLPLNAARVIWCVMLVSCVIFAYRCIWSAAMVDGAFQKAVREPARFFLFVGVLAAASAGHVLVPLGYQAHDPFVFMLLSFAAWRLAAAMRDGDRVLEVQAGVALGLAASCKVMPVVALPVMLACGRWRIAVSMAVTGISAAIGFDLVSLAITGTHHFPDWIRLAAGGADLSTAGGGRWGAWNPLNQSGTGILSRFITPTPPERGLGQDIMIVQLGETARRVVLGVGVLLVLGGLLLSSVISSRRIRVPSRSASSPALWSVAVIGATSCAYLLVAPHASNYHFAPVSIAVAGMAAWWITRGLDWCMLLCLVVMVGIELVPGRDVLGSRLTDLKLALGSVGACALAGLVGSVRVMFRSAG
jgi:hypothetical protein